MATTKIEYFSGNYKIGEKTSAPFTTFDWLNVPAGNHALTAKLYVHGAYVSTSPVVNITVGSASGGDIGTGATYAGTGTVTPEYQAVLNKAVELGIPTPNGTQQTEDNQYIINYKATPRWAKEGGVFKFKSTADPEFRLIDLKRAIKATQHGGIFWTDNGAAGDGSTGYIDPKAPLNSLANWALNDAGVAYKLFKASTMNALNVVTGVFDGTTSIMVDLFNPNLAINADLPVTATSPINEVGVATVGRQGSAGTAYKTPSADSSVSSNSTAIPSATPYILARNRADNGSVVNFTDAGISYFSIGANTQPDHATFNSLFS